MLVDDGGRAYVANFGFDSGKEEPRGGEFNEVRFDRVTTARLRVVFTNAGKARSGVTEVLVWRE